MTIADLLQMQRRRWRTYTALCQLATDPPSPSTVRRWAAGTAVPKKQQSVRAAYEILEALGYGEETIKSAFALSKRSGDGRPPRVEKFMWLAELEALTLRALADDSPTRTGTTVAHATVEMQDKILEKLYDRWRRVRLPTGIHRSKHGDVLYAMLNRMAARANPAYSARYLAVFAKGRELGVAGVDAAWTFARAGHD